MLLFTWIFDFIENVLNILKQSEKYKYTCETYSQLQYLVSKKKKKKKKKKKQKKNESMHDNWARISNVRKHLFRNPITEISDLKKIIGTYTH